MIDARENQSIHLFLVFFEFCGFPNEVVVQIYCIAVVQEQFDISKHTAAKHGSREDETLAHRELHAQINELAFRYREEHDAFVFVFLSADGMLFSTSFGGGHVVVLRLNVQKEVEVSEPATFGQKRNTKQLALLNNFNFVFVD